MVNQPMSTGATSISRNRPGSRPATGSQPNAALQQVSDAAKETASKATETAKQQADTQLQKVSEGLERVAQTLHQSGTELRQSEQAMLANYVDNAATQVERASDYLRASSVTQIIDDVQSYARREPVVAIGVAVGLGFLAARLLKASVGGGSGSSSAQAIRYQVPAYSNQGNDGMTNQHAGAGSVGTRYGDGA